MRDLEGEFPVLNHGTQTGDDQHPKADPFPIGTEVIRNGRSGDDRPEPPNEDPRVLEDVLKNSRWMLPPSRWMCRLWLGRLGWIRVG